MKRVGVCDEIRGRLRSLAARLSDMGLSNESDYVVEITSLLPPEKERRQTVWSNERLKILTENYSSLGAAKTAVLCGVKAKAVRAKASKLQLKVGRRFWNNGKRPWTDAENETLRAIYPLGGARGCMPELPGRTSAAITGQAHKLGVRARRR